MHTFAVGLSRVWGDSDGIDITDRALAGWGTVDGSGFCRGPATLMWFLAAAGHCGNGVIPPISGRSRFVFASFLAYPLAALLGPILSWISYLTGHRRASIAFMAMPLVVISAVLVGFILLDARCGGRFAC
jgi:hypothetical protein